MAKITLKKGGEDIARLLMNVSKAGTAIGKMATYEGAKVIADEIRQSAEALPAEKYRHLKNGDEFNVISEGDKADLLNSIGIAEIKKDENGVHTVVGFAGYGSHPTRKYPKGLPMPLLARAIESGSSVRRAQPFVRPVVQAKRKAARAAMAKAGQEAIQDMVRKG